MHGVWPVRSIRMPDPAFLALGEIAARKTAEAVDRPANTYAFTASSLVNDAVREMLEREGYPDAYLDGGTA